MITGISVKGSDQYKAGTNCQDFWLSWGHNDRYYIAVADGVGSQPYSDFGSKFTLNSIRNIVKTYRDYTNYFVSKDFKELLLSELLTNCYMHSQIHTSEWYQYLMTTFIVAEIDLELNQIFVLYCGDGYYGINDKATFINSGDSVGLNRPNVYLYAAYKEPVAIESVVVEYMPNKTFWIATDGIKDWLDVKPNAALPFTGYSVPSFETTIQNPKEVVRTIKSMNMHSPKRPRLLSDDTTIVMYKGI